MTPAELRRRQIERYATDFELVLLDRREGLRPGSLVQAAVGDEIREVVAIGSGGECLEAKAELEIRERSAMRRSTARTGPCAIERRNQR